MKHKQQGRKFGRVRSQRKALLSSLLGSLVLYEKIVTTEAKAKEIKPLMDKIITRAKKAGKNSELRVATIRNLNNQLPKEATQKLMGDMLARFESRSSGYTRITKNGPRTSDSAKMATIEFV
jgi:large subunit ribosomal protein L17